MKFPTGGSGQDFEKVPAGTHIAVLNMLVDVGTQPGNPKFAGVKDKEGKADQRGLPCPTVYLRFEVPAERATYQKNGQDAEGPMTIYVNMRASMNAKAKLRTAVHALHGKLTDQEAELFDVDSVLGKACMILVEHSEDGKYANVKNFMALPKGTSSPKAENPLLLYSTEKDGSYDALPKFLREKIDGQIHAGAPVAKAAPKSTNPDDAFADDEATRQTEQLTRRGDPIVQDDFNDPIPF